MLDALSLSASLFLVRPTELIRYREIYFVTRDAFLFLFFVSSLGGKDSSKYVVEREGAEQIGV